LSARVLGYGTTAATTIITITTTVVIADINIHMHWESNLDPLCTRLAVGRAMRAQALSIV